MFYIVDSKFLNFQLFLTTNLNEKLVKWILTRLVFFYKLKRMYISIL